MRHIYTRGSNQHAKSTKTEKQNILIMTGFFIFVLTLILAGFSGRLKGMDSAYAQTPIISPLGSTQEVTPIPNEDTTEVEKIIKYIKTIFGKDWKTACAVAKAESGLRTTASLVWAKENSRGIFQINIQSEYAKVHYDRIPGDTLEEKITWLEDPYNNTLLAYWIFTKSGWNPWTAYTSGAYEAKIDECK